MKKRFLNFIGFVRLLREWRRAISLIQQIDCAQAKKSDYLIIPCDPWGVVGSRGDQAMILSVIQQVRSFDLMASIDILTDSSTTDDSCSELGLRPLSEWSTPVDVFVVKSIVKYRNVYILGADVTDGVYSGLVAMKLLMYYDCFSRCGVKTHYLGFSWSKTPCKWLKVVFAILRSDLPLPVRDPVSYERVKKFTTHRPLLQVADVAFMLKPKQTKRATQWIEWCSNQHELGRKIIAINVHQMFNDKETKSDIWESAFADTLNDVLERFPDIAYLLIPHDNRKGISDHEILRRMKCRIRGSCLIDCVMNADEIKAVIGCCDGLIAGRMHISIGALGMCVPVFGLVYQGKFEGLWKLFGLEETTLLRPSTFITNRDLAKEMLFMFVASLSQLRQTIGVRLNSVMALSERNFR